MTLRIWTLLLAVLAIIAAPAAAQVKNSKPDLPGGEEVLVPFAPPTGRDVLHRFDYAKYENGKEQRAIFTVRSHYTKLEGENAGWNQAISVSDFSGDRFDPLTIIIGAVAEQESAPFNIEYDSEAYILDINGLDPWRPIARKALIMSSAARNRGERMVIEQAADNMVATEDWSEDGLAISMIELAAPSFAYTLIDIPAGELALDDPIPTLFGPMAVTGTATATRTDEGHVLITERSAIDPDTARQVVANIFKSQDPARRNEVEPFIDQLVMQIDDVATYLYDGETGLLLEFSLDRSAHVTVGEIDRKQRVTQSVTLIEEE